ncbi:MAG TPA: DNA mismatch repair endonuclease MutH [Buchnera sp. (in: enterobacteria)]|nr:DNA mismatch repair endonuclease MutH [Buchnera sp. (in: enterobacteria)]
MSYICAPPINETVLLRFAEELSGCSLGELSGMISKVIPTVLKKNKGFIGYLLEEILGAGSGNKAQQDFLDIGVELKTIPINKKNIPLESTFVCSVPLKKNIALVWNNSYFYKKIKRILWIPIQGEKDVPVSDRLIGKPFLWTPNSMQENLIRSDWEELMDLIILGGIEDITGKNGTVLQVLKRSSNCSYLTHAIGKHGEVIFTVPRYFYLKKTFTFTILKHHS